MRIHTDTLTVQDFQNALSAEKRAGCIAHVVGFAKLELHGSTTHARGVEVQLEAYGANEGDGRRYGNSGGYGATSQTTGNYAATYDEWGWLLAALFLEDERRRDDDPAIRPMRAGSAKYPVYADLEAFDHATGYSYHPDALIAILERDNLDPYAWRHGREGACKRGYYVGRYGYGRVDALTADRYASHGWGRFITYHPRTVADVRAFAKLEEEN